MSRNITEFNRRAMFKTWHFTSGLEPTLAIRGDIDCIATDHATNNQQHILLVKACITEKVMSQGRPDCVTFTTWRFSRADAALWVSYARDKILLPDLPFEKYICLVPISINAGWPARAAASRLAADRYP